MLSRVNNDVVEAITEAARDCACDLIVMASHGRSGQRALLTPSLTTQVMRQAGVAVLVTRSMATGVQVEASRAMALIQDEHRSLAAVLHGMKRRVGEARSGAAALDRELMHLLENQHLRECELADTLNQAWQACPEGASGNDVSLLRLEQALAALAEHVWEHLRLEEESLLPLACEVLKPDDWREVAEIFEGNEDPGFGEWSEEDFRRHFTRVANVALLPEALPETQR